LPSLIGAGESVEIWGQFHGTGPYWKLVLTALIAA
jgi:hypothetical protein